MDSKQNAVIAKSRAIYGGRITAPQYKSLMQKQTVPQIVSELKKSQRYHEVLKNVNELQSHRGQIESLLERSVFDAYIRMFKFSVENRNDVGNFYIRQLETDLILKAAMHLNAQDYDGMIAMLPTHLAPYSSFNIMDLASARSFDSLLSVLSGTVYEKILKTAMHGAQIGGKEQLNIEKLTLLMYTEYYKSLLDAINHSYSGQTRAELLRAVHREIGVKNFSSAYRMRAIFGMGTDEIMGLMIPISSKKVIHKIQESISDTRDVERILKVLKTEMLKVDLNSTDEYMEISIKDSTYRYFKRLLITSSNGIVVMYSLIKLLEIEQQNITTIIEGVRYGLPITVIEGLVADAI